MKTPTANLGRLVRPDIVAAVATAVLLVAAYYSKLACFGSGIATLSETVPGGGLRILRMLCYSDIQSLWTGRHLDLHLVPYLNGGLTAGNTLAPGTLEYPVLSGILVYLLALPASGDLEFYQISALFLGACAVTVSVILARSAGWRALWFALAPSLVLYAYLNWDLTVVLATVAALACAHQAFKGGMSWKWLAAAGILLAVGGALKFYPLMFAAPIALRVLLDGASAEKGVSKGRRWTTLQWKASILFVAGVAGLFALVNLPFVLLDYPGWLSAYQFQWSRPIDDTTQSIWYWGLRPWSDPGSALQKPIALASSATTAAGLLAAVLSGLRGVRRGQAYPWIQVCAAMLCAYLVFNKVHSPQYALWFLPFLILVRTRAGWIVAYLIADFLVGTGWYFMLNSSSDIRSGPGAQMLVLGVWGRPALLAALFVVFLSATPAWGREGSGARASGSASAPDGDRPRATTVS